MSIILILIGYFLDYKANQNQFKSDLKIGLTFFAIFIFYHLILGIWLKVNWLYIIFANGIEIILIFFIKAFIDSRKK